MNIQDILAQKNYTLIDVREPFELQMDGSIEGAVNIPTGQIEARLEEIRSIEGLKLIFCKSGGRSQGVSSFLQSKQIPEVFNAGSYIMLRHMIA